MNSSELYSVTKYITPISSIIKARIDSTLGSVAQRVRSSHEAIYVFDEYEKFCGLVSPYKEIYINRTPYTAKLGAHLFHPPHITYETSLFDICRYMIDTRLYTLPVQNEHGTIIGIIQAKNIFKGLIQDPEFLAYAATVIVPLKPHTIDLNAAIEDAFNLLREKGGSRIAVTDDTGKLAGILTRSDVQKVFMVPTPKQRFSKSPLGYSISQFDPKEKSYRREEPVRMYLTQRVHTISAETPMLNIVRTLITSDIHSIVIVDTNNRPTGILSMRDLLVTIASLGKETPFQVDMNRPSTSVNEEEYTKAVHLTNAFAQKIAKRIRIHKIEIAFKEAKNVKEETISFETSLIVTPIKGKKFVAHAQSTSFIESIRNATDEILSQEQRYADMHHYPGAAT